MSANQIIRPDIRPPANGANPVLGKLRRKLGLTFILSNPFRVPVNPSPAAMAPTTETKSHPTKRDTPLENGAGRR